MFLVPNKHSSSNLSTSRAIYVKKANFCVSQQRVKGNILSMIVLQMTVLTV